MTNEEGVVAPLRAAEAATDGDLIPQGAVDDLVEFWHTNKHEGFLDDAARAVLTKWWPKDEGPREYQCDQPAHATIPCERCQPIEDGGAKFLGERYDRSQKRNQPRCWGISSDALALVGVGAIRRPLRQDFPSDEDDLAACERTFVMAPPHIQARMLPVLEEYRAAIADKAVRYGWRVDVTTGPEDAAQPPSSEASPR
jgi:hypothetical protein